MRGWRNYEERQAEELEAEIRWVAEIRWNEEVAEERERKGEEAQGTLDFAFARKKNSLDLVFAKQKTS